jgi:hypothetical protein
MTTPSFLTLDLPCDMALQVAKQKLSQAGLRALQTFDLHTARLALHECACPNHGTADCDCQMVILMIYGETAEPATLILHGNDGKTWFSVADDPSQSADRKLIGSIKQALDIKALESA